MNINQRLLDKALRYHAQQRKPREVPGFLDFVKQTFFALYNTEYRVTKHHQGLCDLLEQCARRELPEGKFIIVVNIAPRFGKTLIFTLYVAWCYVHNGGANFIYVTYSKELSFSFSREVKDALKNVCELKTMFKKDSTNIWETAARGKFLATTINGVATGFAAGDLDGTAHGGDLIFDDPNKISDVFYEVRRNSVYERFNSTFKSRRNKRTMKGGTPIIVVQQRTHVDDLSGRLLQDYKDNCIHYVVPALVNGESIFPERMDTASLLLEKENDPYTFYAQYMQDPRPMTGGFFNMDNVQVITSSDFEEMKSQVLVYVRSWDFAGVGSSGSVIKEDVLRRDWTRGVKIAFLRDSIVIMDMVSQRGLTECNDILVDETSLQDGYGVIPLFPVDPGVAGEALVETMKKLPGVQGKFAEGVKQNGSKIVRAQPLKFLINRRKVYIIDDGNSDNFDSIMGWQYPLMNEGANFPFSKNDDTIDALSLGVLWGNEKFKYCDLVTHVEEQRDFNRCTLFAAEQGSII